MEQEHQSALRGKIDLRAILRLGDVLIAIIFSHCCSLFVSRHSTWSAIVPLELLSKSKDTCSGSFLNVC